MFTKLSSKIIEWNQPKGNHMTNKDHFTKKILGWYFMECLTFLKPFRSAHSGIETQENAMNKSLCISPLLPQILKKKSFEIFCFKCQT